MYASQKTRRSGSGFPADFQPCLCIDEDISGSASTTDQTQKPAWQRRLTLIDRLQRETRRDKRACLIRELRQVTTEALSCAS